jgi:SH3-like domain-containing protein
MLAAHSSAIIGLAALLTGFPGGARALEFRSVAVPAAILYDAPSAKGRKLSLLNQGYPVEILVTLGPWLKVRDAVGELSWIEAKNLSSDRMVMVKVQHAEVRKTPDDSSAVLFDAQQDLLLELLGTMDNWAQVKHRDGTVGYVHVTALWGL